MKQRILDLLVCPACKERLTLEPVVVDEDEIMGGRLTCRDCRAARPGGSHLHAWGENLNGLAVAIT